jgi:hypothetical protein
MLSWSPDLFTVPSGDDFSLVVENLENLNEEEIYRFDSENDPVAFPWYFSATSLAIRFLGGLSQKQRMCMRKVELYEHGKTVSNPETHAQGLIPFCQENAKLHIERHVGLWHHIYPS